jgi:nitrite reductase (NO-forming)
MEKALNENPEYVVFNGSVGALVGDNAIKASVGETVRLYIGNGGPNLISSFHVIGEIFDKVYVEGGGLVNANVQTTLVPAGGSAIVDFKVEVPGTCILVDHSIFRTFNKGSLGMLKVDGPEDKVVYSGKLKDDIYLPEGQITQIAKTEPVAPRDMTKNERIKAGEIVFNQTCFACHQANGQGLPGVFPPLAKSDYLMADARRAIGIVISGKQGEVEVNNVKYNQVMTPQNLNDEQIANVLTFVMNSWGNEHDPITPDVVAEVRAEKAAEAAKEAGGH